MKNIQTGLMALYLYTDVIDIFLIILILINGAINEKIHNNESYDTLSLWRTIVGYLAISISVANLIEILLI